MRNWFVLHLIIITISACQSSRSAFTVDNGPQLALNHKKVAVIPFAVTFSDTYKNLMAQSSGSSWQEQERIAGIDLQKNTFAFFVKRADKRNFELIIPDYNTINQTLAELGIPYSQLITGDKAQLATMLGVDAVIFGHSYVQFDVNRSYMGTNGVSTVMEIWDGFSGQRIWATEEKVHIRSHFDSPQNLAIRNVGNLVNRLPYSKK